MKSIALSLWLLLAAISSPLSAGELSSKLQAYIDSLQSLQAHFEQQLYGSDSHLIQESSGEFWLQRPDKFRWDYQKPYQQLIVADGKKLWLYDEDLAQVTVKSLDNALGAAPIMLLSGGKPLKEQFEIRVLGEKDGLEWYKLIPLQQEGEFTHLYLAMDASGIKLMELEDNFGQATQIHFSELKRNQSQDAELFRFEPPEGVDLVGDQ